MHLTVLLTKGQMLYEAMDGLDGLSVNKVKNNVGELTHWCLRGYLSILLILLSDTELGH